MRTHKDLKNFIKNNGLVSYMDHIIACDDHGWTDLRFTQLDNRLTPESKYFLAININSKPHILYNDKLLDLRQEIEEKMIKGTYIKGYDKKNNRVHLHYEGDGIFRIGNKNGANSFRVPFKECDLKELAKRKDYSLYYKLVKSEEKHRVIQTLLCELGISLGFNVKLARNDESNILNNNFISDSNSKIFLSFSDLNLDTIVKGKVKDDIDFIDIMWCDPYKNNIIFAFEVERNRNYANLFQRFSSLKSATSYPIDMVGVGNDFNNFKANFTRPIWESVFLDFNPNYLFLDDLFNILTLKRDYGSFISTNSIFDLIINKLHSPIHFI